MSEEDRNWQIVEFETTAEQEDLASWLMIHLGARGCQISPVGQSDVLVSATFDARALSDSEINKLRSALEEYGLSSSLSSLRFKSIADQDWLVEWKKGFVPIEIGKSFLICPPWSKDELTKEQVDNRHVIVVEPGMAFGTGHHATTRYCLEAIETQNVGQDILDVGTGSGILAIGAALLKPAATVVGVDNDPVAVKVATENVALNVLSHRISIKEGSTEIFENLSFDCLLSNLTCEDILALLIDYLRILRPGGTVICAGILKEKLPMLRDAIASYPLSIIDEQVGDMWAGVTLERIGVSVRAR